MQGMELKFMTPTEVWEGFDACKAPLEASIISCQTTDNFVCEKQIFTADTSQEGRIRICCNVYYDARWQDARPAILLLPSFENPHSQDAVRLLVEEGFVTCALDFCGVFEDTKTAYPSDLSFARYPDCKARLDYIENTARNTPWFVWAKVARRAISLLQEQSIVSRDHIGLLGFGIGAQLAWMVAGTDKRVCAMCAVNGGGYRWAEHNARFLGSDIPSGDVQLAYSTGVGAETYAMFITCPTLAVVTSDSVQCDIDRIGDMLDLVKSDVKQLIVSESCDIQITNAAYRALILWLRAHLASSSPSIEPSMRFEATDGKLYVKINTAKKAEKRTLYVSYGEPSSRQRYWKSFDVKQKVGEHEYVCDVPVYDTEELIVAYATFVYPDSNIISTKASGIIPAKHNVQNVETTPRISNIIYDGSMGVGEFVAKTDEALLADNALSVAEGPFAINGITLAKGNLILFRSIQEMTSINRSAILHIDAYSKDERPLNVTVYTYPDFKKYTARTSLKGGEFWQKLLFETADFKSEEGRTLASFSIVKTIVVEDVDGVVLNNFLWI